MNKPNSVKMKAFDYIHAVKRMMETSNELHVDYFYYSKLFYDGTRISLSNEDRWFRDFTTMYYNIGVVSNNPNSYKEGYMLWPVLGKEEIHNIMDYDYSITNQITLVLKNQDNTELFTFATDN